MGQEGDFDRTELYRHEAPDANCNDAGFLRNGQLSPELETGEGGLRCHQISSNLGGVGDIHMKNQNLLFELGIGGEHPQEILLG